MLRVPKFLPRIARQASFAASTNVSAASSIFRVSTNKLYIILRRAACSLSLLFHVLADVV